MRRLHIFLFSLIIALSVLLTLALTSFYFATTTPSHYGSSWMGQMWGSHIGSNQSNWGMGGMMGGNGTGATTPSYLWLVPTVLIGIISIAIIGVGFYSFYPELKYIKGKSCTHINIQPTADNPGQKTLMENEEPSSTSPNSISPNCDILLKTMTPEEQKVLNVLIKHKGKYLQKYVSKEAELNRLKTHRIIARFAQRGIVSVKEFGNTNEVLLADWVENSKQ